ncbi:MAG: bifunctional oligoribonuclease/PAP phosphatase NrnA [Clostridia bacterium]
MNSSYSEILDYIKKNDNFLVVGHAMPDGDCMGSCLAFARILKQLRKKYYIVNKNPIPVYLEFLLNEQKLIMPELIPTDYLVNAIFYLDCGDVARSNIDFSCYKEAVIINIDHHISNTGYGNLSLVQKNSSSTGEVIFELFHKWIDFDCQTATALYTAIETDTGSFKYANASAQTMEIAAKLLKSGADKELIRKNIYNKRSLTGIQAISIALNSLQTDFEKGIAWLSISYEDKMKYGLQDEDYEGIVYYANTIENIEVGVFFKENSPGNIKVSLRSNSTCDVNAFAQKFGGGGHLRAAGCNLAMSLLQAEEYLVNSLKEYM